MENMAKAKELVNILSDLGEKAEIIVVDKNNGVKKTGISVGEGAVKRIFYAEQFLDYSGEALKEAVMKALASSAEGATSFSAVPEDIAVWENVKDKLVMQLVGKQDLDGIPHIGYLDLNIVFRIFLGEIVDEGIASILVKDEMLSVWGVTVDDLYEIAKQNTPQLLGKNVRELTDILTGYLPGQPIPEMEVPMKVITNERTYNGAIAMLYPDVLQELSEELDDDLYVIPSSVHEVIAIPIAALNTGAGEIAKMIVEINQSAVQPEEVLGDHAYIYSRDTQELMVA